MLQDNTTPIATVENDENLDDFSDLDDLLDESTKLAKARRNKNQGRKLDAELEELLESSRDAEEHRLWEPTGMVGHFVETTCSCGQTHRTFDGWFQVFTHRRLADVHRLTRVCDPEDWEVEQWTTVRTADYCATCLDELKIPTADYLEIFDSLGEVAEVEDDGQLDLFAEAEAEDLLEEIKHDEEADHEKIQSLAA
jgi:hypothetical protein